MHFARSILNNLIIMTTKRVGLYIDAASTTGCVCPGDTLTYECTVTGGIATFWTGTAFDCPAGGNDIILRHSLFTLVNGVSGSCNNGVTVARSLAAEDNNYTSQLNVIITPETAGKTIECFGDGSSVTLFFSSVIPTITGLSPSSCTGSRLANHCKDLA